MLTQSPKAQQGLAGSTNSVCVSLNLTKIAKRIRIIIIMSLNVGSRLSGDSGRVYFRNGFVLGESNQSFPIRDGWSRSALGNLQLVTHPETPFQAGSAGNISLALIGQAFDPERAIYNEAAIVSSLLEDVRDEALFNAALDRLAGRFVIVVNTPTGTEIYQDAMGSRSVFYSTAGQAVAASHAELVREILGTSIADFFVPLITSIGYRQRNVKYLPGVASPYIDVLQLTPNTKLLLPEQKTKRFWPRESVGNRHSNKDAADVLIRYLEGLGAYMKHHDLRPVAGLTAGTDSRGVFAAVKDLDPYVFTYVRSEKATATESKDALIAAEITAHYDVRANVWPILSMQTLNGADDAFSHAFRLASGYQRGVGSTWLPELAKLRQAVPNGLLIHGFGGEVMRGFYQPTSKKISGVSLEDISRAYEGDLGTNITRQLFGDMMERTEFAADRLCGYDPNDIFYWEHRMGTWGSVALSEADLAMPSITGYNSRNLFTAFMRLSETDRLSRAAFKMATDALAPKLSSIPRS